MANINLEISQLRSFVAEEVASQDTAAVDLERFKRQVELYLQDLLRAVQADLQEICDTCCPSGSSP